jgi:hypothetical protein
MSILRRLLSVQPPKDFSKVTQAKPFSLSITNRVSVYGVSCLFRPQLMLLLNLINSHVYSDQIQSHQKEALDCISDRSAYLHQLSQVFWLM